MNAVDRFPDEYQEFTKTTAVYPQDTPAQGLSYVALGLCDELGELFVAIKASTTVASVAEVIAEAGDVCWYAARICDHLDFNMADVCKGDYHGMATQEDAAIRAMLHAAIIAGRVKKTMRDSSLWNEDQATAVERSIFIALREVMAAVKAVARADGVQLHEVMQKNMTKLQSRKDRGKLQGDGDNR